VQKKIEHAIDYEISDSPLILERYYGDQYTGWSMTRTASLLFTNLSNKSIFGSLRIKLKQYDLNSSSLGQILENYVDVSTTFANGPVEEAHLFLGREH
jgi:hypothetical protein